MSALFRYIAVLTAHAVVLCPSYIAVHTAHMAESVSLLTHNFALPVLTTQAVVLRQGRFPDIGDCLPFVQLLLRQRVRPAREGVGAFTLFGLRRCEECLHAHVQGVLLVTASRRFCACTRPSQHVRRANPFRSHRFTLYRFRGTLAHHSRFGSRVAVGRFIFGFEFFEKLTLLVEASCPPSRLCLPSLPSA